MGNERRVVAVSTARPAWQDVRGQRTFTSIVRSPAPGALWFGAEGPDGNETAVHTEAVLASPAEHYAMWTERFGVDRAAWDWCRFGENIVVSGFDENNLRIGDIVRIGEAVFRVTSPRIPCFKFAWRMDQPDSVLGPMIESGHVGFYLAVETPGRVAAGDSATTECPDPSAITVGDLSRLLVARDAEPQALREPLANRWLGGQARGMLAKRIAGLEDMARLKTGRWSGWRPFRVAKLREEAQDIASFTLTPLDDVPLAPPLAGQFLTVRLGNGDDAPVRSWTLSDHDDALRRYRLTVKRLAGGEGSALLHEIGARGGTVWARPPAGRFTLKRDGFMRVVLISAGIGVTPMLAMLKAHRERQDSPPPLVWIHQTRSGETHAFAATGRDAALCHVFYSAPREDDAGHEPGRLTPERLREILAPAYKTAPFGREIELEGIFSDIYICGPAPFEAMVRDALAAMGVPPGQVRSESFVPGAADAAPSIARAQVDFGGTVAEWTQDANLSLLELAEAAGLAPAFGCRSGSCGACESTLVSGRVEHSPSPAMPLAADRVLLCCARPASDVAIAFD
jgi:uncharacterized protein